MDDTLSPSQLPNWLDQHPSQPLSQLDSANSSAPIPDYLANIRSNARTPSHRELMRQSFEIAFDRIIESMYGGATLEEAVRTYPVELDLGMFNAWVHRDAERKRRYDEAKEFRSEVWAGRMIAIAEGVNVNDPTALPEDIARSRLRVDTLMKLIAADNRKTYAPSSSIDINQSISITAALEQARGRLIEHGRIDQDPSSEAITHAEG